MTTESRERLTASVGSLATLQLSLLGGGDAVDDPTGNSQRIDDVLVQHPRAAARDRAQRDLLVTGHSELSNDERIEGCVELFSDAGANWDSTAWKAKDDQGPANGMRTQGYA
jgi:hypothetical protein